MDRDERIIGTVAIACALALIIFIGGTVLLSDKFPFKGFDLSFITKDKSDEKLFQKLKLANELGESIKIPGLVEDFITTYPESKYRAKVDLIACEYLIQNKEYDKAKNRAVTILQSANSTLEDAVSAVIILGEIGQAQDSFDPETVNYLQNAYLKADALKKQELAIYLGYAYIFKKDYMAAVRYFNSASGEFSIIGRARAYIEQGMYPEAIQEYRNYFMSYPAGKYLAGVKGAYSKQTLFYSDKLVQAGLRQKAMEYLQALADQFPREDSADAALIKMANISMEEKKYPAALSFTAKALNNSTAAGDDEAYLTEGIVYYQIGKKTEAYKIFQDFKTKFPASKFAPKAQEWMDLTGKELRYE